jgi:hypothetical protein
LNSTGTTATIRSAAVKSISHRETPSLSTGIRDETASDYAGRRPLRLERIVVMNEMGKMANLRTDMAS